MGDRAKIGILVAVLILQSHLVVLAFIVVMTFILARVLVLLWIIVLLDVFRLAVGVVNCSGSLLLVLGSPSPVCSVT